MPRRVKPVVLIGLIAALVLSIALLAGAKGGGGSRDAALAAATGQIGMPYGFGTDGPGSFSCTGLVRHALRSAGVDDSAPWDHMAYLGVYPTVSDPQPGDVVVYPDGAAMYVGNGQIVMANHADGKVGTYGMNEVGTPVGFASPYGGAGDQKLDPAPRDQKLDPAPLDQGMETAPTNMELDPTPANEGFGEVPLEQGFGEVPLEQGFGEAPLEQGFGEAPLEQGLEPAPVNQAMMP